MDVGQLFGFLIGLYFFLLAAFAAIATAQALEDDDRAGLSGRVFWSLTKTTLFLGLPGLIGVLVFLNTDAGARDSGGIMSRNLALGVLFLGGAIVLVMAWLASITLGFVATRVVQHMRPLAAAGTLFFIVAGAPILMALTTSLAAQTKERERRLGR